MYTLYTTRSAKLTSGGAGSLHFADMILFAALNACSELVRFGVVFPSECARPRVKLNIIPIFLCNRQICAPGNSNTTIYDQFPIARVFHRKLQTNRHHIQIKDSCDERTDEPSRLSYRAIFLSACICVYTKVLLCICFECCRHIFCILNCRRYNDVCIYNGLFSCILGNNSAVAYVHHLCRTKNVYAK